MLLYGVSPNYSIELLELLPALSSTINRIAESGIIQGDGLLPGRFSKMVAYQLIRAYSVGLIDLCAILLASVNLFRQGVATYVNKWDVARFAAIIPDGLWPNSDLRPTLYGPTRRFPPPK